MITVDVIFVGKKETKNLVRREMRNFELQGLRPYNQEDLFLAISHNHYATYKQTFLSLQSKLYIDFYSDLHIIDQMTSNPWAYNI